VLVVAEDDNTYSPQLPIAAPPTSNQRAPPSFQEEKKQKEVSRL
jgi:hypothetical protein